MSKKSSTNIRKSTVLGSGVLALGREANRPYCENVSNLRKSFLHPQQGKTKCMLMMSMKPSTNSHIQGTAVSASGPYSKIYRIFEKNVSTPPRMHFEKTKRMVMMSINSIVKFMGPVSVVKVLRRANIAIKCTCKCKK